MPDYMPINLRPQSMSDFFSALQKKALPFSGIQTGKVVTRLDAFFYTSPPTPPWTLLLHPLPYPRTRDKSGAISERDPNSN